MTEPLPTAPTSSSRPRPSRGTVMDRSPASGLRSRAVDSAPCCFTPARFCDSTSSASLRASDASRASRAARSRPGFSPQCGNRWGFPAASAPTSSSRNLRQQRPRAGGETLQGGAGRAGQGHLAARRHRPRRTLWRLLGHRYQSGQCTAADDHDARHLATRLSDLGETPSKQLVNWGYAICDRGVRSYYDVPAIQGKPAPAWPYPEAPLG
jgi:hypothetical protein